MSRVKRVSLRVWALIPFPFINFFFPETQVPGITLDLYPLILTQKNEPGSMFCSEQKKYTTEKKHILI